LLDAWCRCAQPGTFRKTTRPRWLAKRILSELLDLLEFFSWSPESQFSHLG